MIGLKVVDKFEYSNQKHTKALEFNQNPCEIGEKLNFYIYMRNHHRNSTRPGKHLSLYY